jgi:C1A family cysteine protease
MTHVTPLGHGLGRIADLGDIRDKIAYLGRGDIVPFRIDLRPMSPPIGDQGRLGSCTAWASLAAWGAELLKQTGKTLDASELAQYYWTRKLERTQRIDAGASIRDAIKTLAKKGVVPEESWPYDPAQFAVAPPPAVEKQALLRQALAYAAVPQALRSLKQALASGYLVVFGISVYESFESDDASTTGVIPLPQTSEQLLGGHAICLAGYDDSTQHFTFRNSWGTGWGNEGYGYLPYDYVLTRDLASDFWVVKQVEEG